MVRFDLSSLAGRIMPSLLGASLRDPELDRLTRELGEERARPVREILGQAVARGELPAHLDDEVALGLIVGPLLNRKLHRRRPLTAKHLGACIDTAVAASRPPPAPARPPASAPPARAGPGGRRCPARGAG